MVCVLFLTMRTQKEIKENSKTNCPLCYKKKPFKYIGWCASFDDRIDKIENIKNNFGCEHKCVCGASLDIAYNRKQDIIFINCFRCFPHFEKVGGLK